MVNNIQSKLPIKIYGQQYFVVKLVPLRIKITSKAAETGVKRYVTLTATNIALLPKNFLISYAMIHPEFWVDRGNQLYTADECDLGFNIKDLAVNEDFVVIPASGISVTSDYFGKTLILGDELITFPEINWKTPLMWTYWDTPQSNPVLEFITTNRSAVNDYDLYFTATLIKLHIIPDDLVEPTV
jgi:hypothetical protein